MAARLSLSQPRARKDPLEGSRLGDRATLAATGEDEGSSNLRLSSRSGPFAVISPNVLRERFEVDG
jgi:hypothetical protein